MSGENPTLIPGNPRVLELKQLIRGKINDEMRRTAERASVMNPWYACFGTRVASISIRLATYKLRNQDKKVVDKLDEFERRIEELIESQNRAKHKYGKQTPRDEDEDQLVSRLAQLESEFEAEFGEISYE